VSRTASAAPAGAASTGAAPPAEASDPAEPSPVMVVLSAGALLAFFVALYPALGVHVPIGSDAPVYVWWARLGGAVGLGPLGTGARPAAVGLVAALAGVSPTGAVAAASALGPVVAVALALAAATLATVAVQHPRSQVAFGMVVAFVGAFLGFLVPGYLSTVAFLAPFVGVIAVVVIAAGRPGTAPFLLSGLLLAAAGMFHPLFLLLGAGVSAGAAVALVPGWLASRRDSVPFAASSFGRLAMSWALALPVVGLGLAASGAGTASNVDTSRDSVLRRIHLGALLRDSYRRKLHHDVPWWRSVTGVALALTALPLISTRPARDQAERERGATFWGAMGAWLLITVVGVTLLLLAGSAAPGQRLFVVCLPLPVLAAIGVAAIRLRRRWPTVAAITVCAGLFVASFGSYWWSNRPLVTPVQAEQARAAGEALGRLREGTPLILVVDDRSDKPSLFVTRYANVLRGAVPAARVPDVHIWVGTPGDFLRRTPTVTGLPEHDRLSVDSLRRATPSLRRKPLAIEIQSFDPKNYRAAAALPGSQPLAPGIVALPGHAGVPAARGSPIAGTEQTRPGAGPVSPWLPVWFAPLLLLAFGLAGWPWVTLALPAAGRARTVALAPTVGIGAFGLGAVVIDALGIRLSSGAGSAAIVVVALAGWLAFAVAGRPGRRGRITASASALMPDSPGSAAADPA
jgi:hypothetical protein